MSWFRRNPLDDILPGELMPGVPERGSVEEAQLIDKVLAERPWRGLWYGFFYLIRQWCFTGYTLICAVKFGLPFWSFIPVVALGFWMDVRKRRTVPDFTIPDRTYVTHILRQEPLRSGDAPDWRDYFDRGMMWTAGAYALLAPIAIHISLYVRSVCGVTDECPSFVGTFTLLVPELVLVASIVLATLFWVRISKLLGKGFLSRPLEGALSRRFWKLGYWSTYSYPMGYHGWGSKLLFAMTWLFLVLIIALIPIELYVLGISEAAYQPSFFEILTAVYWWVLALFAIAVPIFATAICWDAQGAAIARSLRAHIFAASVELENQGVAKE